MAADGVPAVSSTVITATSTAGAPDGDSAAASGAELGSSAAAPAEGGGGDILYFSAATRQAIRAKTAGQRAYVEEIRNHDVVFGIGPAGTGKTYLAVACAVDAFERDQVSASC